MTEDGEGGSQESMGAHTPYFASLKCKWRDKRGRKEDRRGLCGCFRCNDARGVGYGAEGG